MFLGIYDYTVILTYISLGISVFGITRALEGDFKVAIFCLALSGLCDMFDGKIARTKKNRTDDEKNFGIQIDSLCDVVCFGIFPAMIWVGIHRRGLGRLFFTVWHLSSALHILMFQKQRDRMRLLRTDSIIRGFRSHPWRSSCRSFI